MAIHTKTSYVVTENTDLCTLTSMTTAIFHEIIESHHNYYALHGN